MLAVKKGGPAPRIQRLAWHHTAVSSIPVQLSLCSSCADASQLQLQVCTHAGTGGVEDFRTFQGRKGKKKEEKEEKIEEETERWGKRKRKNGEGGRERKEGGKE